MTSLSPCVSLLEFERLDARAWRLCDRAVPCSDPDYVVAYVERLGIRRVLVVWVRGGYHVEELRTFDAVRDRAVERRAVTVFPPE